MFVLTGKADFKADKLYFIRSHLDAFISLNIN